MTNLVIYGVEHPLKNNDIIKKIKNTVKDRYNVDNVFQSEEIKNKIIETSIERYGTNHPQQNNKIKQKTYDTNITIYGYHKPSMNKEISDKGIQTKIEKYGKPHNMDKSLITIKERYNVDNISQLSTHKEYVRNYFRKEQFDKLDNLLEINYDENYYLMKCDCGLEHDFKIHLNIFYNRYHLNMKLCTFCYPEYKSESQKENMIKDYITTIYNDEIFYNKR